MYSASFIPHTHTHSLHIALMYGYIVIRHEHITNLYTVTLSITICRSLINAKCYHSSYTLCSNNNISCVCARACVSRTRIDPRHLATNPFTIKKKKRREEQQTKISVPKNHCDFDHRTPYQNNL